MAQPSSLSSIYEMKDYYLILGIDRDADKGEIKRAYRDSAKKYHPDSSAGIKDTKRFRDITEAYETLSNTNSRKEYDRSFCDRIPIKTTTNVRPSRPSQQQDDSRFNPSNEDYLRDTIYDLNDEPESSKKILGCEIRLTADDINEDIEYPYTIGIIQPCYHCNEFLIRFTPFCPYCSNNRYLYTKKELIVNIPKGIENNTKVNLNLDHVGLYDVELCVTVSISNLGKKESWIW